MTKWWKVLSNGELVCLPCGDDLDGALLNTEERPDLEGEECSICQR